MKNLIAFTLFVLALTVSVPSLADHDQGNGTGHQDTLNETTIPDVDYSRFDSKINGARAMGLAASLINPTFHHQKWQSGVAMAVSGDTVALAVGLTVKLNKSTSTSFALATDTYEYTAGAAMNWFW